MSSILVVDDEADIRKSLRGVLEDEGYKVSTADTGEACLDVLKTRSLPPPVPLPQNVAIGERR